MAWTWSRRTVLAAGISLLATGCQAEGGTGDGPSPFTGEKKAGTKVLAVKVDNVAAARPHTGLEDADIIYTEQVEAGLTRILAIFASQLPRTVGPVRSARESDLELLRQFGHPALAYSGAQSKLQPVLEKAPLEAISPGKATDAFVRSKDRKAPHNLFVRPTAVLRAAPEASAPADIGFQFGPAPDGGRATKRQTVRYPAASFDFDWSAEKGRWLVSMDGSPARTTGGEQLSAATVIVQTVTIRESEFRDKRGSVSPFTETVGKGKALVLRDGKVFDAQWSRPSEKEGTAFTDKDGRRIPFPEGPVWVALAPKG